MFEGAVDRRAAMTLSTAGIDKTAAGHSFLAVLGYTCKR